MLSYRKMRIKATFPNHLICNGDSYEGCIFVDSSMDAKQIRRIINYVFNDEDGYFHWEHTDWDPKYLREEVHVWCIEDGKIKYYIGDMKKF